MLVAELQLPEIDSHREGAREAREPHMAVAEPGGGALKQRPPPLGIACNENRGREQRQQQHERAKRPRGDSQCAAHQKA